MSVLGAIVKSAINLNQNLSFGNGFPKEEQLQQLINLLHGAKDTAFGKYYGFQHILDSDDVITNFRKSVPIHDYNSMQHWWKQQQLFPDVTWQGQPDYFALTSGTTGKSPKRIPVTYESINSSREVAASLAQALANFDLPSEVFESKVLMLSSSAKLKKHANGHLEGEISGININNFPTWYELFYAPGHEIAEIDDWDERLEAIVKKAPEWDIGSICGIPSWVLMMLKAIIKEYDLKYIQDIWPNLQVFATGGVAFDTYRKDFEKISNKEWTIIDTYLASEGFFAFTSRPNTMAMELAISHGYFFEFVPFDERGVDEKGEILDEPLVLNIDQVKIDEEYIPLISTPAGIWRYVIGDTVKFTDITLPQIKITGRLKFFLNAAGSQLSEEKMDAGISELSDKLDCSITEYMVAIMKDDEDNYYHQWVIVSNDDISEDKARTILDDALKSLNHNYEVARNKALKGMRLLKITKAQYTRYMEDQDKKGGQSKTQKVMDTADMTELLDAIS